jgi:hypothetical protein
VVVYLLRDDDYDLYGMFMATSNPENDVNQLSGCPWAEIWTILGPWPSSLASIPKSLM